MISNSKLSNQIEPFVNYSELDRFAEIGNELADAAGEVIRKYFRTSFDILDKDDLSEFYYYFFSRNWIHYGLSVCVIRVIWVWWIFGLGPVTVADKAAEESMVSIIEKNFPSHAM